MIPGSKILTYEVLPRNQLNENNEWVPDTPAIFLSISYLENINSVEFARLSQMMTDMTGHEVNIDGTLSIRKFNSKINFNNER